jgi:DNA replication protein DnaC
MRRYTDEMFKELRSIRREIILNHDECKGSGFVELPPGNNYQLCICSRVFSYIKELVYAKIPRTYWTFKLSNLEIDNSYKKFIQTYLANFDNAIAKALGIIFLGPNGVGKTAMMCEIAKSVIAFGYVPFYTTAQGYIDSTKGFESKIPFHPDARVILIDEMDKAYIKEGSDYVPKTFEDFLRSSISNGKVVIAASNEDEKGLESLFGESTLSMIKRHLKIIPVSGEDFSKERQDSWLAMLKEKVNWFHPNIVEVANMRRFDYLKGHDIDAFLI